MTTLHLNHEKSVAFTKGSCDVLLNRCTHIWLGGVAVPLSEAHKKRILKAMEAMSLEALRVLALAFRAYDPGMLQKSRTPGHMADEKLIREDGLTFVGLAGMMDPPRPEAGQAVEDFKKAGVRTVMITGDHVDTALAVARPLGIAHSRQECMTCLLYTSPSPRD